MPVALEIMSAHFLAVEVELGCQSSAELSSLLLMPRTLDSASVDVPQPEARRKNQQENASSRAGWGCHGKIGLSPDAESSGIPFVSEKRSTAAPVQITDAAIQISVAQDKLALFLTPAQRFPGSPGMPG
jgi:hypothetical protein